MKRKFLSILFALVLVCSLGLVTAVPVAAQDPSTFTVTGGTYTTTPTGPEPYETGTIAATLIGTWDVAVIGEFTATGEGGLYLVDPVIEPQPGSTADIDVSGVFSAEGITFTGTAVWVAGDPITPDNIGAISGTITIQSDGSFVADLTGNIVAAPEYIVVIFISGLLTPEPEQDLAVNGENPWMSGAFAFIDVSPGEALGSFPVKFENVGTDEGVLTFSISYEESDIDGAPAPNMDADEFASLVYVAAVTQQYFGGSYPEGGGIHDDLSNWEAMDINVDGKVSLYELMLCSPIPWATAEGDTLPAGEASEFVITFQLGDSLEGGVAGGDILTGVDDSSSQGDGISVTVSATLEATLESDTEQSSGNVFQAAGVVGPVLNVDTDVSYGTIQLAIDDEDTVGGHTISVAAGTYNERVDINKSLTLEGANVGIPGSGTRGPESIINPQGLDLDFGVLIYGADTIATFDGFTVENYARVGILAGSYSISQVEWPNPSVVHILNNIVKEPIGQQNNNCIQVGFGTTGTIIGNEVFGAVLESPAYSGSGILVSCSSNVLVSNNYVHDCEGGIQIMGWPVSAPTETKPAMGPAEDNIIEYNLAEGNKSGIVAQQNAIGTIVRYNDALNNASGIVSVGWFNSPGYFPSGTQIHYNNIDGNENYGVRSYAWDDGEPEQVNAKANWWGNASGPIQVPPVPGYRSYGDKVSANVEYEPWLLELVTEEEPTTYDKTLALKDGWTLVSVDKAVAEPIWVGTNPLAQEQEAIMALKYTPTGGFVSEVTPTDLQPLTAIYVQTNGGGGIGFNYAEDGDPAFYSKDLEAGWNLISIPGMEGTTGDILSPLRYVTVGTQQVVGLTTLVSQGKYNQFSGSFYDATLTNEAWGSLETLYPFDGYWANMEAADTFEVPY